MKLFVLLRDEQHDPNQSIDSEYRLDEVMKLYESCPNDEMAIHVATGLPQKVPTAS
ncbi:MULTISPECIES: PB1 domain-containing protein [Leptolyngbya]|uniref:hypothetical protein n=1 Tax=Leptolyngbya TaxID=47251 RepID=UPI0003A03056|nr:MULTISPECIES: hypothetical protein [Leptolyngbya]MBD2366177.1 hypothetical protein [Leptolyngbya sp. FACHB-161]MBD2372357.1 hypothetical protein [Leptolyngbya sp. FACHB-238]MBD2396780.1 hypothetical protein [Leptolyngbya sp. FACHB-239]MBD2403303.1 hypothetical protein [Leptolyngbya sp. FACHB-402]ULP32935.1 hypothetical protein MCP04_14425 [Leptolyngbya boryana IU 594]